jgi:hypothetical protein
MARVFITGSTDGLVTSAGSFECRPARHAPTGAGSLPRRTAPPMRSVTPSTSSFGSAWRADNSATMSRTGLIPYRRKLDSGRQGKWRSPKKDSTNRFEARMVGQSERLLGESNRRPRLRHRIGDCYDT